MYKSPLNYIGGKYRLLPQLLPLFPKNITTFVDLFAGGLDVSLNIRANCIIANDINHYVIGIYKYMQQLQIETIIKCIGDIISQFSLTKTNKDGYEALRDHYNRSHDPLELFVLVCFGFNHQLRFNSRGQFNNPFGMNRSSYNDNIEKNLRSMHHLLQRMEFVAGDFRKLDLSGLKEGDFVYADPPYLISCGSYNDGKRGFEGWNSYHDLLLFRILDSLNERGISFALSNVTEHKGMVNIGLNQWRCKYNTHYIETSYSNSSYHSKKKDKPTVEVLITNY